MVLSGMSWLERNLVERVSVCQWKTFRQDEASVAPLRAQQMAFSLLRTSKIVSLSAGTHNRMAFKV